MPSIDRNSSKPYYQQVYEQIARGIDEGVYLTGKKLPSIRECAHELGVSNTTIELAYQKLSEEGYVESRRGSGYTICATMSAPSASSRQSSAYQQALDELKMADSPHDGSMERDVRWDFAYDAADHATFPYSAWARICREVFFDQGSEAACLYNDPQGLHALREQIALYVNKEYGVMASAEQVLVMPTTRDVISNVLALFDADSTTVAMEEPGYDEVTRKLRQTGFTVKPITVYPFPTWKDAEPMMQGVDVVFVTPACQFPSNTPMPVELRRSLVEWAEQTGAYLIDDEYGWEFQTGMQRTPTLAAFDHAGRVITLGTFSNSFTPAVCLSYAILPPQLMLEWRKLKAGSHPQVPWQTQAAMAAFMSEGHWRTHIRKIRTSNAKKRHALLEAIRTHLGNAVEVLEGASSLFVLMQTRDERTDTDLIDAASDAGVRVYSTCRYFAGPVPENWRYVLVGYAGIALDDIDSGIRALAQAWR